jgi:hypothetical protein
VLGDKTDDWLTAHPQSEVASIGRSSNQPAANPTATDSPPAEQPPSGPTRTRPPRSRRRSRRRNRPPNRRRRPHRPRTRRPHRPRSPPPTPRRRRRTRRRPTRPRIRRRRSSTTERRLRGGKWTKGRFAGVRKAVTVVDRGERGAGGEPDGHDITGARRPWDVAIHRFERGGPQEEATAVADGDHRCRDRTVGPRGGRPRGRERAQRAVRGPGHPDGHPGRSAAAAGGRPGRHRHRRPTGHELPRAGVRLAGATGHAGARPDGLALGHDHAGPRQQGTRPAPSSSPSPATATSTFRPAATGPAARTRSTPRWRSAARTWRRGRSTTSPRCRSTAR